MLNRLYSVSRVQDVDQVVMYVELGCRFGRLLCWMLRLLVTVHPRSDDEIWRVKAGISPPMWSILVTVYSFSGIIRQSIYAEWAVTLTVRFPGVGSGMSGVESLGNAYSPFVHGGAWPSYIRNADAKSMMSRKSGMANTLVSSKKVVRVAGTAASKLNDPSVNRKAVRGTTATVKATDSIM